MSVTVLYFCLLLASPSLIYALHSNNISQASETKAMNKDNRILIQEATQQVANKIGVFDIQRVLPSKVSNTQNAANKLVVTKRTTQSYSVLQSEIKELQRMQEQLRNEIVAGGKNQKKEKLLLHIETQIQARRSKQTQHGLQTIPQQLMRPPNQQLQDQQVIQQPNNIKTQMQHIFQQHNTNQLQQQQGQHINIYPQHNRQMRMLDNRDVRQTQYPIQRETVQGMLYQQPLAMVNTPTLQPATSQHLVVPLNALSLDNIIQNQILPKRYIVVNAGADIPNIAGLVPPDAAVRYPTTTLPTTTVVPTTPPTYRSTSSHEAKLNRQFFNGKLEKQQLEIRKLHLEIRALQRTETNIMTSQQSGEENEDAPFNNNNQMRFDARRMNFPFFK